MEKLAYVKIDEKLKYNLLFLHRFGELLKLMFPRWRSSTVVLFVFLMCISLLEQIVIYNIGMVPGKFYKVLNDKDIYTFWDVLILCTILIVSIAFIHSTSLYTTSVLYIHWRKLITQYIHSIYFKKTFYYKINVLDKDVDNPDQRITQDVDKMCNQFSQIIAALLISPFTIAYYVYQAWHDTGYLGPVSILVFFIIMTFINKFLMSCVITYFVKQEKKEGDFRYKHMQVRTYAEAIAFYRAGTLEGNKANEQLQELIATQQKLMNRKYALNFSIQLADYLGSILSYVVLSVPIFAGTYDSLNAGELGQLISKYAFVCIYLISCFTKLIDMAVTFSDVAGATHRIGQLIEALKKYSEDRAWSESEMSVQVVKNGVNGSNLDLPKINTADNASTTELVPSSTSSSGVNLPDLAVIYKVQNLSYGLPSTDEIMLKELNLMIKSGCNLLITGDSGCGKSSLLRVLGKLWTNYSGHIDRYLDIGPRGMLYLPQKPYFTNGTLREQIIFPLNLTNNFVRQEDDEISEYLECADLMSIYNRVGGFDIMKDINWLDLLSPGEMQRLSFVRLFYHKPPFAALDEATSQIGINTERKMYMQCKRLGITVISIGHRESLNQYHDSVLHLDGLGGWTLTNLNS